MLTAILPNPVILPKANLPFACKWSKPARSSRAYCVLRLRDSERAELSFGHTSYQHVELEGDEVGTRFVNHANEARLLLNHEPLAGWQGAFGLQGFDRAFKAVGDESFVIRRRPARE